MWCGVVVAGDADLDTSFGDGGIVTFDGSAASLSLQDDGSIVVAGSIEGDVFDFRRDVMVRRFNADGAPDVTFGSDGIVTTDVVGLSRPVGPKFDRASDVAVQVDGKIVVAGHTGYDVDDAVGDGDVLVVRYYSDGSLDETFGDGGAVTTDVTAQSVDWASAMVLQPDGKILVAGAHLPDAIGIGELVGVYADVLLVRYLPDGSLDNTFGTNGIVMTRVNADTWDAAHAIALQPDGRIVVAGESQSDLLLARYNTDGALDETFGQGGFATMIEGSAGSTAVQPDGKIVVSGLRRGDNSPVLLARYEADGSLDSGFGRDGVTVTSFDQPSQGTSVVVRADGRIVVAGSLGIGRLEGPPRSQLLLRYNDAGELDATFGTDGVVVTAVKDRVSGASEASLQTDGRLVVADLSGAVVRYGTEAGLRPLAEAPLSTSNGFRFLITNYDPRYDWTVTTTAGQTAIDSNGVVVVTGIGPGATATVAVTTSRPGYETASTEVTGSSLPYELPATGSRTPLTVIAVLAVLLGALSAGVAHPQQRRTERSRFPTR